MDEIDIITYAEGCVKIACSRRRMNSKRENRSISRAEYEIVKEQRLQRLIQREELKQKHDKTVRATTKTNT